MRPHRHTIARHVRPSVEPSPASVTILLVDDDPETLRTFAEWLRLEGYEVRTAPDGEAALPRVGGVDAIILDARMPVLDGLGFLRRLRGQNHRIPVAIVTGDYLIDDEVLREFAHLDAQLVLKPLWVDDVVALVDEMIGRRTAV